MTRLRRGTCVVVVAAALGLPSDGHGGASAEAPRAKDSAGGVKVPELARAHALAYRANLASIKVLVCRYEAWVGAAASPADALQGRLKRLKPSETPVPLASERGVIYINETNFLNIAEDMRTGGRTAWLRDRRNGIRVKLFADPNAALYRSALFATPGAGEVWTADWESRSVPYRLLACGVGLYARPDYKILGGVPCPSTTFAVTVSRHVEFHGYVCDSVGVVYGPKSRPETRVWFYFKKDRLGMFVGKEFQNIGSPNKAWAVVLEWAELKGGQWWPTKVLADWVRTKKGELYLYEVVEVTELEERAPDPSVFDLEVAGDFTIQDLGHRNAFLLTRDVVRGSELVKFLDDLQARLVREGRVPRDAPSVTEGLVPGRPERAAAAASKETAQPESGEETAPIAVGWAQGDRVSATIPMAIGLGCLLAAGVLVLVGVLRWRHRAKLRR